MAGLTNAEKVAAIAAGTNPSANNNTPKLPEKKTTSSTTRRNTTTAPASTGTAPLTNAEKVAAIAAGTNPSAGITTAAGSPLNQSRDAQVRQAWAARPATERFAPTASVAGQTKKVPQATVSQRLNALGNRISQNEKQLTNMGLQLNRLETAYNRGDYSAVDQYNALADRYNKAFETYVSDVEAYNQLYKTAYRDQGVRDSYARREYMQQRQAARDQGARQLYEQRRQEEALRAPITTTLGKENERVVERTPNRVERVIGAGLSGTASGFTTAGGLVLNNQFDEHDSRTMRRKGASVGEHSYKRISGEEPREAGYTYAVSPAYQQRMARAKLTADGLIDTGRRLNNRSTLQTNIAKEGLGETGQMLVDLGVMAVQMAADIGIAAATGGSMLVPLGIRSYGNGYLTAEQMGFTGDAAQSYALGVAAVEVLSEKMFSVFGIVNKFARGAVTQEMSERVIDGLVKRLASSAGGRTALNRLFTILFSAGSEGLEEVVAGVMEPLIRKYTLDRDVKALKEIDWQETLYEGLLGGILGGLGGAVDLTNTRPTYWKYYKEGIDESIGRYEAAVKKNGLESKEALQAAKEVWDGGTRKMNAVAGFIVGANEDGTGGRYVPLNQATMEDVDNGLAVTYHQLAAAEEATRYGRTDAEGNQVQGPSIADSLYLGKYLQQEENARREEETRKLEEQRKQEENVRLDTARSAQARDVAATRERPAEGAEGETVRLDTARSAQTHGTGVKSGEFEAQPQTARGGVDLSSIPEDQLTQEERDELQYGSGAVEDLGQYTGLAQRLGAPAVGPAARTSRAVADNETAAVEGGGAQFSIETTEDGKRYVQADRQVMTGEDPLQWGRQIETYINEKIRQGEDVMFPTEDGHLLVLTDRSAWKLTDRHKSRISKAARELLSDEEYGLKLRAASQIDELIQVGRFYRYRQDEGSAHQNDIGEGGFNYFEAYFQDANGEYYRVRFSAGLNGQQETVYSIGNIQKRRPPRNGSSGVMPGAHNGDQSSSGDIIYSSGEESQEKSAMQIAYEQAQKKQGGTDYGRVSDRSSQRDAGERGRGGSGSLGEAAEGGEGGQVPAQRGSDSGAAQADREPQRVRKNEKHKVKAEKRRQNVAAMEKTSGEAEGIGKTDGRAMMQILTEEMVAADAELTEIKGRLEELGYDVRFFVGSIGLQTGSTARGAHQNGTVWIRVDDPKWTATQISRHEELHGEIKRNTQLFDKLMDKLRAGGAGRIEQISRRYQEALLLQGKGKTEKAAKMLEEMLCDIYAGINEFTPKSENARSLHDLVKEKVLSQEAAGERQTRAPPSDGEASFFLEDVKIPTREELDAKPDMAVVTLKPKTGWQGDIKKQRKAIKDNAEKEGMYKKPYYNNDTDSYIFVIPATLDHAFSNRGLDNVIATEYLKDLIYNAVLTNAERSNKAPDDHTTGVYTFFAAVNYGRGIRPVKLKVKEFRLEGQEVPKEIEAYFAEHREFDPYASLYDNRVLVVEDIEKETHGEVEVQFDEDTESDDHPLGFSSISVKELLDLVKGDAAKYVPQYGQETDFSEIEEGEETGQQEAPAEMTAEELQALAVKAKAAERHAQKVMRQMKLTDKEQGLVNSLLKGALTLDEMRSTRYESAVDKQAVQAVYQARQAYRDAQAPIEEYNKQHRESLNEEARSLTENSFDWKSPGKEILLDRETPRRVFYGITKDAEEADALIHTYVDPIREHEAQKNRMIKWYHERIEKLKIDKKKRSGNKVSEAYAVQYVGELEFLRDWLESLPEGETRGGLTYGEAKMLLDEFWEQNPNLDQDKIHACIEEFRGIYDELFAMINEARVRNGYRPIDYRKGYFPHFTSKSADTIVQALSNGLGFGVEVTELPTDIAGLTYLFKPGIQWSGHMLQRTGNDTDYNVLEGWDRYIPAVANIIYHTDDIQRWRALERTLRYKHGTTGVREKLAAIRDNKDMTEEERDEEYSKLLDESGKADVTHLGAFVQWIGEYTNYLAGKRYLWDRLVEAKLNRKFYSRVQWLENRVAANMLAGNISSAMTNFIPLFQAMGNVRSSSMLRAIGEYALGQVHNRKQAAAWRNGSNFLVNRKGYDPLYNNAFGKVKNALFVPFNIVDDFTSEVIVRARYYDELKNGASPAEAMALADIFAGEVMADRTVGELPVVFNSKTLKVLTMFQVEVNNDLSHFFKDIPRDAKRKGSAAWLALLRSMIRYCIAVFLYNDLFEAIWGRRVAFDPLSMVEDVVADLTGKELPNGFELIAEWMRTKEAPDWDNVFDSNKGEQPISELFADIKEWGENVPFLSGMMGGGRYPVFAFLPNFGELGSGVNTIWDLAVAHENAPEYDWQQLYKRNRNLLAYMAPPAFGGQIRRTVEGVLAARKEGSYTVNREGERKLQYPILSTYDKIKAAIFGKSSTKGGREWTESGFDTLSTAETQAYLDLVAGGSDPQFIYDIIQDLGGDGRTGVEKAYALAASNLKNEERVRLLDLFVSESQGEKFAAMMTDGGLTFRQCAEVYEQYKTLDKIESLKPMEQAIQFETWLDGEGYTDDQKAAITEQYKYYNQSAAEPKNYKYLVNAGLTIEKATELATDYAELEKLPGESQVTKNQKMGAVAAAGYLSESDKQTAVRLLHESKKNADGISQQDKYKQYITDYQIPVEVYYQYCTLSDGIEGDDLDGDGKKDAYTKCDKLFAIINRLPLQPGQKTALAIFKGGVAENTVYSRAPWLR